jgi:CRP/FNR family transcriptional regulator, anaerobic regulatory protein
MISHEQFQRISNQIPVLKKGDQAVVQEFQQKAVVAHIAAGKDVFVEGDRADAIALLISGVVRVYKLGESGREITLYRFGLGESCILTANAILSQQSFPAIATVEQEAEAVMIPADTFRDWVGRYPIWRDFVFDLLSQRLTSVMMIVDEVVFRRLDARVASFLLNRVSLQNPIPLTHQEIADELGSSREVISRILEGFSSAGIVNVTRGAVKVLELESLRNRTVM